MLAPCPFPFPFLSPSPPTNPTPPPTLLLSRPRPRSFQADSWALGAILFVLLTGRNLFVPAPIDRIGCCLRCGKIPDTPGELQQLMLGAVDLDPALPPEACDLVLSLCRVNPAHRLSVWGALAHPFVLGLRLGEVPHPDALPEAELRRLARPGARRGPSGGLGAGAAASAATLAAGSGAGAGTGAATAAAQRTSFPPFLLPGSGACAACGEPDNGDAAAVLDALHAADRGEGARVADVRLHLFWRSRPLPLARVAAVLRSLEEHNYVICLDPQRPPDFLQARLSCAFQPASA